MYEWLKYMNGLIEKYGFWKAITWQIGRPWRDLKEKLREREMEKLKNSMEKMFMQDIENYVSVLERAKFQDKVSGLVSDIEMIEKWRTQKVRVKRDKEVSGKVFKPVKCVSMSNL